MFARHARLNQRRFATSAFRKLAVAPDVSAARAPFRRRALIEALEPRLLMSAELPGVVAPPPPPSEAPLFASSGDLGTLEAVSASFAPLPPAGALIHRFESTGAVTRVDGSEVPSVATFAVEADRRFGFVIDQVDPALQVDVRVVDADGDVVAQTQGAAAGAGVALPAVVLAAAGDYSVEVRGVDASTGTFRLRVVIDAAIESESIGGTGNDTSAAAQSIDAASLPLVRGATRLAVVGVVADGESDDWYSVTVTAGDVVSFVAAGDAAFDLAVFDAADGLLARGAVEAGTDGATQRAVRDLVVAADGELRVRVTRAAGTDGSAVPYQLVATRGAHFDPEVGRVGDITRTGIVLGSLRNAGAGAAGVPWNGVPFRDGENWNWDVQSDGSIGDGTSDAYDGGVRLVNYFGSSAAAQLTTGGREVAFGPVSVNAGVELAVPLDLTRRVYVSDTGGFARFLETVTNRGDTTVTYRVQVDTNLGSDGGTRLIAESGGSASVDAGDRWLITDDIDASRDPSMLHVVAGDGFAPDAFSLSGDRVSFGYDVELDPGESASVLHFAAQSGSQALAAAKVAGLLALTGDALRGLTTAELASIVNFDTAGRFALAD
nr:LEPR-XLL domain-containing protein [Burkholderiales bacterium]